MLTLANGCIQQPRTKGLTMSDGANEGSAAMRGSLCPDAVARRKARLLKKWERGEHLSDEEADYLDRHIPFMYDDRGGTHE